MAFYTDWDEELKRMNDVQEQAAFQKLKEDRKIEPVVLIAHPKFKSVIHEARKRGADLVVLWSPYSDEDKIYQVTDPTLRDQIIEIVGGQPWREKPV